MKPLLLLLFVLHTGLIWAADPGAKKSDVYGDVVVNDSLKKILSIDGVTPIYEDCKKRHQKFSDKIPQCIWDEVVKKPDMKKAVQAAYAEEIKTGMTKVDSKGRTPATEKTDDKIRLTDREKNVAINYESDPAVAALSKFYGDKLDQILDPEKGLTSEERKNGVILSVDHRKFADLYKSELGKTIINAFTSYCMETDPSTCCKKDDQDCAKNEIRCTIDADPDKAKAHKISNLESLKKGQVELKSGTAESFKWSRCIMDVPDVCESKKSNDISKQRACLIVDYVKAARKNIMIVDDQKKFYDELAKTQGRSGIAQNIKIITDENKATADAILEMTAKDVKDTLKDSTAASEKEMDGCFDKKTNQIVNAEVCKKFLNTNTDANEAALAEFGMRQLAQEETLKEELKSSNARVADYLKEEGYSDQEIQKITQNKQSIEDIKKQITERFAAEKKAIIQEMSEKIQGKTSSANGKIDAADTSKLEKIRSEISGRSSDLANLVQFNNIVSSYLNIDNGGKMERNTASLFAEVRSMDKTEAQGLQNKIKDADLKDKKSTADLNVDTINNAFLNYETSATTRDKSAAGK